jgi:hypothetical protein
MRICILYMLATIHQMTSLVRASMRQVLCCCFAILDVSFRGHSDDTSLAVCVRDETRSAPRTSEPGDCVNPAINHVFVPPLERQKRPGASQIAGL